MPATGGAGDHLETPVRDVMTPGVVTMPESVVSDLDLVALEGE